MLKLSIYLYRAYIDNNSLNIFDFKRTLMLVTFRYIRI